MTTAEEYVNGLRELADWFEAHPEIERPSTDFSIYATDSKENAEETMRALLPCKKKYDDSLFTLSRSFGPFTLHYVFMRNTVCTPKVVGQREVPLKVIPPRFEPEKVIEAHTEDVIEWECEPVLAVEDAHEPV